MEIPRRTSVPLKPDSSLLIGRYAVGDELGRGGAAIVYRAADRQTGGEVAIKMLRPELAGGVMAERFRREIRVAERLRHPNILPIIDTGDTPQGTHFYAMPLVVGGALTRRLAREGALPFRDVVRIAEDVAAALDYAHDRGVLHRDVKPENVLFDGTRAVVADFGIARTVAELEDRLTESGAVIGTPLYMSPEQADANGPLDRRSDVYSLGCLIYEMLAGEPPFGGPSVQSVLAKHCHAPVPRLATVRQTAPEEVQQVLERALAKVPADRYETAGELVRALSTALRDAPRSIPPMVPASSSSRRPWMWVGGALVAIAAGTLIARRGGAPALDPHRIAVMYLADLSPDRAVPYLADGLTETLIDQLSRVEALRVISSLGVRAYRNRATAVDSIAQQLGVGTIIDGSVQQAGDSVRVAIRLIDAASGRPLYSKTILENMAAIVLLQDSVMNDVAFALRQHLGAVIEKWMYQSSTKSTKAWEADQVGNQMYREALERHADGVGINGADDLLLRADSLYARAESIDPHWPVPTLGRAKVARVVTAWGDSVEPPESAASPRRPLLERWSARAIRFADEALKKGQDTADVLDVRGALYLSLARADAHGGDTLRRAAERDLRASVERRPRLPSAWTSLADLYLIEGRADEALDAAQKAYDADAFFEVSSTISRGFQAAFNARRLDRAGDWCQLGLRRYPNGQQFALCRLRLMRLSGASKTAVDSAWKEIARLEHGPAAPQLVDQWGFNRAMVAAIAARAGLRDSARHIIERVRPQRRSDGSPALGRQEEAYVDLLLGDRDDAVRLIAEQLRDKPAARDAIARNPWFDALHADSAFKTLVRPQPPSR